MRLLSRILKSAQTVPGSAAVRVYQPEASRNAQQGDAQQEQNLSGNEWSGNGWSENGWSGNGLSGGTEMTGKRYALISEEKRKILEHARDQAEQSAARILEEAYAQRDNIVNIARDEAGRIQEQARQDGYAQGLKDALGGISHDIEGIRGSVADMEQEFEGFKESLCGRIASLSFMMAERILRKRVEEDETEMLDLIEQAVLSERDKRSITVHVPARASGLVEELEQRLNPLMGKNGSSLRIKTEDRPAGFVQVETEEGIVDASLDVQLTNLKKQLTALEGR